MNKLLKILPIVFFSIINLYAEQIPEVYFVSLKENESIPANPIKKLNDPLVDIASEKDLIQLFPSLKYQKISGFGGCFNEIGGIALTSLSSDEQKKLMQNLFDAQKAGFTFCRTAVGSSDFGVSAYSYSEIPNDYNMDSFSILREKKSVIPYIQLALEYNPYLKLFASPWSPPAWMKMSGKMEGPNENNYLKDDPLIYKSYALYFTKYIEEYAKLGIHINRLMVQNETDCNVNYPSCIFPPDKMIKFINNYLAPMFKEKSIKTEIWGGTYRVVENSSYEALLLFSDSLIRKNVKGVGMQYQEYNHLVDFRMLYPQIPIMHTECVCYGGENSVDQAYDRLKEIAQYINAGSENFTYWNMILDETSKSGWGWRQNSLITIDKSKNTVKYNPDYAVMYILSHFIRPGDVRIAHIFMGEDTFAVKDDNGNYKFFVTNRDKQNKTITIRISGREDVHVKIPAESLTLVIV